MHGASVTVAQLPNTSKIAKVAENYSLQKNASAAENC